MLAQNVHQWKVTVETYDHETGQYDCFDKYITTTELSTREAQSVCKCSLPLGEFEEIHFRNIHHLGQSTEEVHELF